MDNSYPYVASLTREPFLFYEMRITAKLMCKGLDDDEIVKQIVQQNLFQYPTERTISKIGRACIKRLHGLGDEMLVSGIASQPMDVAKQICLYAMMRQSRLVWEFMLTVIGEKYRLKDSSFGKIDLNTFFMRLQEQNDTVFQIQLFYIMMGLRGMFPVEIKEKIFKSFMISWTNV